MEKRDRWLELIDRIQTVVSGISLIMANYAFTASVNLRQIFLQEGLSLYSGPMVDFNLFFFLYRKLSAGLTAVEKFRSDAGRNPLFTSLLNKNKKTSLCNKSFWTPTLPSPLPILFSPCAVLLFYGFSVPHNGAAYVPKSKTPSVMKCQCTWCLVEASFCSCGLQLNEALVEWKSRSPPLRNRSYRI